MALAPFQCVREHRGPMWRCWPLGAVAPTETTRSPQPRGRPLVSPRLAACRPASTGFCLRLVSAKVVVAWRRRRRHSQPESAAPISAGLKNELVRAGRRLATTPSAHFITRRRVALTAPGLDRVVFAMNAARRRPASVLGQRVPRRESVSAALRCHPQQPNDCAPQDARRGGAHHFASSAQDAMQVNCKL